MMQPNRFRAFVILICLLSMSLLLGCAKTSVKTRHSTAGQLAISANWMKLEIPTQKFVLTSYVPKKLQADDTLTIYIEGDGLAWVKRNKPSSDPSPINPIALKLALKHAPYGNVAYLARPCQYTSSSNYGPCRRSYWTNKRFSEEVVFSSNQAIGKLKQYFHAKKIVLVGYSGGGAIATLVAARRTDVVELVTVAGNLDHKLWTRRHNISPLSGSLNPKDYAQNLKGVPQIHFVGMKDKIIPHYISGSFISGSRGTREIRQEKIANADHQCCWVSNWEKLYILGK